MATVIKVTLNHTIQDGEQLTFKAAAASTGISKLRVYYPTSEEDSTLVSKNFIFRDAKKTSLTGKDIFAAGAYVTVTLDTTNNNAYVHNEKSWQTGLPNYVIEEGTDTQGEQDAGVYPITWRYRLWADGAAECWGTYHETGIDTSGESVGGHYYSEVMSGAIPFPKFDGTSDSSIFHGAPRMLYSVHQSNYLCMLTKREGTGHGPDADYLGSLRVITPTARTNINLYVFFHCIGRWK